MRIIYFPLLILLVAAFLLIRSFVDRKVEKATGKEVVRENEEYLGSWANKSKEAYFQFRLRRDGSLSYLSVKYPGNDTVRIEGRYEFASASRGNTNYFPRLYFFSKEGDTLFNYYVRYITPYSSTIDKYDRMVLSPNSIFDTIEIKFYRIKQ